MSPPSEPYIYHRLEIDEIRLLHIKATSESDSDDDIPQLVDHDSASPMWEFELVHFKRRLAPSYEAISYVWGDPDQRYSLQLADGHFLLITTSLHEMLPNLSALSSTRYLWIDQISINQTDLQEKSEQVSGMDSTYSDSTRTLAWLGQEDETTKALMAIINTIETRLSSNYQQSAPTRRLDASKASLMDLISTDSVLHSIESDLEVKALETFFENKWFSRMWIFQEAVLPKSVYFVIGQSILPINALYAGRGWVQDQIDLSPALRGFKSYNDINFTRLAMYHLQIRQPFYARLSEVSVFRDATDPRDLLYGMLGLKEEGQIIIQPNYTLDIGQVFNQAAVAIIQGTGVLDIFEALPTNQAQMSKLTLPSWVPDWTIKGSRIPLFGNGTYDMKVLNPFFASRYTKHKFVSSANQHQLICAGAEVDSIEFVLSDIPRIFRTRFYTQRSLEVELLSEIIPKIRAIRERVAALNPTISTSRILQTVFIDGAASPADCYPLSDERLDSLADLLHSDPDTINAGLSSEEGCEIQDTCRLISKTTPYSSQRVIFMTKGGRLGLGPETIMRDDSIAILHGSSTPLLLRSGSEGRFRIIGQCFLEGMMHGEFCTWAEEDAGQVVIE